MPVERTVGARRGDRWELLAYRLITGGFARMPRAAALRTGAAIGDLLYRLDRRRGAVARFNLALAFPDKSAAECEQILRRSCRNLGRVGAEFCHLPALTPDNVRRYVDFPEPEKWRETVTSATEKGAIILTGHLGNWELLAYATGLIGTPVTLVHRTMKNPLVDGAILSVRTASGTRSIAKKSAAREVVRALRRRDMVAIPADQNQTRSFGIFVDFFGVPACTTPGPARLAALAGSPIYPVFLVREGESDRHRVVIRPEIEVARTGDKLADIVTNTQRCTTAIEEVVRCYPDQWVWFHKRWKTRPEGEPRLYP